MISIDRARKLIASNAVRLDREMVASGEAVGRILFEDVAAPLDLPGFRQSAMDGFAILRSDLERGRRKFELAGESQAGKSREMTLQPGKTIQVFTGAVVPANADLVVIQEMTRQVNSDVEILKYESGQKSNIREIGDQVKCGEVAMKSGNEINAAGVGFLASMGTAEVPVFRKPRIEVLITGNELKQGGEKLDLGEIYESNSSMIRSALLVNGFSEMNGLLVKDDFNETKLAVSRALERCDVLIISGGISVGAYDYVKMAVEECGVKEIFYKVNQKPGKPMYFGTKSGKAIFALPGNPASLLVCYYIYVRDLLFRLSGRDNAVVSFRGRMKFPYRGSGDRPEFLKSRVENNEVAILKGQQSFMLKSFAEANCLVYLEGPEKNIGQNEEVMYFPIP